MLETTIRIFFKSFIRSFRQLYEKECIHSLEGDGLFAVIGIKGSRNIGVWRRLTQTVIDHSWSDECKYDELKLDSLERSDGAIRLYEYFGFQRIPVYGSCPGTDYVCMTKFR